MDQAMKERRQAFRQTMKERRQGVPEDDKGTPSRRSGRQGSKV